MQAKFKQMAKRPLKVIIALCYFCCAFSTGFAAYAYPAESASITDIYYSKIGPKRYLFGADSAMQAKLIAAINNACLVGLDKSNYKYKELVTVKWVSTSDTIKQKQTDKLFVSALFDFAYDIYKGYNIANKLSYDEVSKSAAIADEQFLLNGLCSLATTKNIDSFLESLQPKTSNYQLLKTEIAAAIAAGNSDTLRYLNNAINLYRWINHFHFEKYIVVNTGTTILQYFAGDSLRLTSKVIVGKPKTSTPRFAAYCTEVIFYPYWTVPTSIATKELLPKFKRSKAAIDVMNMQVLDKRGNVVDHTKINFRRYGAASLPYTFRQSTGCDNSLGIIKFNLTDPFSVYLHDTNSKKLFETMHRYYSHGCMRVEKAIELGNLLLNNKIDSTYLTSCLKDQKPVTMLLIEKVPVFVIYDLVTLNNDSTVIYAKDAYYLF